MPYLINMESNIEKINQEGSFNATSWTSKNKNKNIDI
jgi:hypothetical protein